MSVWQKAEPRTRMFARVMGPFIVVIAVVAAVRASEMATLLAQFTASAVWPWVTGAFILLGGIAVVAFHQSWRTPAAAIVSALGWLLVIRGAILLAFPAAFASMADSMIGWHGVVISIYVVMAIAGLYLSYVGFTPVRSDAVDEPERVPGDLPRAA